MKLAIATPYPPAYSETFIRMQLERLPNVLTMHGQPVARETSPGGPINPLKSPIGLLDTLYWCGLRGKRWEGPQSAELKRRLKHASADVLLANFGFGGVALMPLCRELKLPLVVHFHGQDAHRHDVLEANAKAYKELGRSCHAVIAVSHVMQEALIRLGFPPSKIRLVRYGIDPELFAPRNEPASAPIFFGAGRFVDKKAPYLTVLAFAEVRKRCADARLLLAGDGPLREATQNLASELGLGESVEFLGIQTPEQIAQHMRRARAFVQHSITPKTGPSAGDSEGTPVVVLEAMMSGVPVIGTRHAGIGEVVRHESTGLLVAERDTRGMAQAMVRLAEDASWAQLLGRRAREDALEHYTASQYLAALTAIVREASESRPAAVNGG